ncbi:MAG: DUF4367 domain-containing protein [Anaerolineales bacterium]|nr:DUF4367 domain-containing protein [Anaerolineales bacterium]
MNTVKRNLIIFLVLMLSALSVGLVAAELIPTADELMLGAVDTLETVTDGHAVVAFTVEMPEDTFNGTVELWGQRELGPNGEPGLRVEVLEAPEANLVGTVAVTDGTQFWLYNPAENTVIVGTKEEMMAVMADKMADFDGEPDHEMPAPPEDFEMPQSPEEAIALLLEYFNAERNGGEMMAGVDAYRLRLVPIPEQMPEEVRAAGGFLNIWLRESDQLPLGLEYAEGAIGYGRIEALEADINIGLPAETFTFDIPAGATVIRAVDLLAQMAAQRQALADEAAAGAEIAAAEMSLPTALPADATAAELQQIAGVAVQRYDRPDGRTFVYAQGAVMPLQAPPETASESIVTVQGVDGTLYANADGSRVLLVWQIGDTMYAIGGDITADEAVAAANSIE